MKNQIKFSFLLMMAGFLFSATLFGQNQMFAVQINKLSPAKINQFTTAHKKGMEIIKKNSKTPVFYNTFTTEDNRLLFVAPIKSFDDLDKINKDIATNDQLTGKELNQQRAEAVESRETSITVLRNDLSLLPKEGTDFSELNFIRWMNYYYHPKDARKMMAVAKRLRDYWAKQAEDGFYFVYQPIFGSELNRLIVVHRVKDLAAIAEINALGATHRKNPELAAINKDGFELITDVQIDYGWYRPDLSFRPE